MSQAKTIRSAAAHGAAELGKHKMHSAARAIRIIGGAAAHHETQLAGSVGARANLGGKRHKAKRHRKAHHTKKRHKGSRKRRSPAQMRAFRKMIAASKKARRGRKRGRR